MDDHSIFANPRLSGFLACIAIAITFATKASTPAAWVIIFIAWVFSVATVAGLPVIKHVKFAKLLVMAVSGPIAFVLFRFGCWLTGQKSSTILRALADAVSSSWLLRIVVRALDSPWNLRVLCFATGVLSTLALQHLERRFSAAKTKELSTKKAQKGFLDYKMQAEKSISRFPSVLGRVTKIIGEVGVSLRSQGLRAGEALNSTTRVHLRIVRRTARMLDGYSNRLDASCDQLETVGNALTEGLHGWLKWAHKQESAVQNLQELIRALRKLFLNMETGLNGTDQYLGSVEALRGVSQEMNDAIDRHLISVTRIRDVLEGMRQSTYSTLQLFENI